MNRREALKAIPGMYCNGRLASIMFKAGLSSKFIIFYNPMLMGPDFGKQFKADFPGSAAYPVDGPLDEAVRIFEQK